MKRIFTVLFISLFFISWVGVAQTVPTAFTPGTRTDVSLQFSWTAGVGGDDYYIVRNTSATITDLVSGTAYTLNQVLASGIVVGITASTNLTDNPPSPGTQYFYKIFNHLTAGNLYSVTSLTGNMFTLAAEPAADPTGLVFSNVAGTSLTLTWDAIGTPAGSGTDRIVIVNPSANSSEAPVDGTTYTALPAFTTGTLLGTNNYVVYKGTGA